MRKLVLLLAAVMMVFGVGVASASTTTTAYVVHGIPGLPVDVYVNGDLFAANFQPGKILGPISGSAGSADIALVAAGGNPATPALAGTFSFAAGGNVTVVAHLDANGAPTVSVFDNDFSATSNARLIARHTAAAPAVDAILLDNGSIIARVGPVANGQQAAVELPAGSYTGGLVPTGTDTLVFGPLSTNLKAGYVYVEYAIGDISNGTFQVIGQTIKAG